MSGLKDIKPLVAVPDITIYYFWGVVILTILTISILFYFLFKNSRRYRVRKQKDMLVLQKNLALEKILNLNYEDSKSCVYDFTLLSSYLIKDKETEILRDEILKKIYKYKYKKDTPELSDSVIEMMKEFVEKVK